MATVKQLDLLWSQAVKIKAGYKCEISGLTKHQCKLNSHHIVGKRNFTLRWDLRNGLCVSSKKHTLDRQSLHQDPEWARQWLLEHRPSDFEYLEATKNMIVKRNTQDRKQIAKDLRAYIKNNIDNCKQ
jgi:hypothetical protein